jgi:cyclic beta-1,2-glucan synthetase
VENPRGVNRGVSLMELDGQALPDGTTRVTLVDDGRVHEVRVVLG